MKTDIQHIEEMDIHWLLAHGWTVQGNLVFRRCLEYLCKEKKSPPVERIEQLLMQYGLQDDAGQIEKIKEGLRDIIELREQLNLLGQ